MTQLFTRLYGLFAYLVFFLTFLYMIGFIGGFGVPKTLNSGPEPHAAIALAVNMALLGLFAVQHTVMARGRFKRRWLRIVSWRVERSTYVLTASLILILLFWQWRPMPHPIWDLTGTLLNLPLRLLSLAGWAIVLLSTFNIDHLDLFGLRQSFAAPGRRPSPPAGLVISGFYRFVRHPLLLGFLVAFWSTPLMTAGHLLFAAANTVYIIIGIHFEERDLGRRFSEYAAYRKRVPMLFPLPGRKAKKRSA